MFHHTDKQTKKWKSKAKQMVIRGEISTTTMFIFGANHVIDTTKIEKEKNI